MPTYEYRCRDCGHSFDIVQKMSDDPLTHCPKCGGELRKVFAPPAISFKGSGFYATDHGKNTKQSGGEKKKDGDAGTSKEGEGSRGGEGSRVGEGSKKEPSSDASSSSTTTKKEGSS
jgi:putative FmdB family regulatory protein